MCSNSLGLSIYFPLDCLLPVHRPYLYMFWLFGQLIGVVLALLGIFAVLCVIVSPIWLLVWLVDLNSRWLRKLEAKQSRAAEEQARRTAFFRKLGIGPQK